MRNKHVRKLLEPIVKTQNGKIYLITEIHTFSSGVRSVKAFRIGKSGKKQNQIRSVIRLVQLAQSLLPQGGYYHDNRI